MADFKKSARLLKKTDYDSVFSKSVKVIDSNFVILFQKTSFTSARLGMVISKKVDKRAVERNRIKRIVREVFREQKHQVCCDYVVIGRYNISKEQNSALFKSLAELFTKAQKRLKTT